MTVNATTGTRYASNVHGQPNANASYANKRTNWDNSTVSSSTNNTTAPKGSITAKYTKSTKVTKKPWTVSAHNFNLNIPKCAYITNITFTARIKVSGSITVNAPHARFNLYHRSKYLDEIEYDRQSGWEEGYFYVYSNKKLSSSFQNITYTMSGKEFRRAGYPISELNDIIMGIDLRFETASKQASSNTVSIQWVSVKVDYELPDPKITYDNVTSEDYPRVVKAGDTYVLTANYKNNSNAGCCNDKDKQIKITLPSNTQVKAHSTNYNNGIWTVPCTGNSTSTLKLELENWSIGEDKINFSGNNVGNHNYWLYTIPNQLDVGRVEAYPNTNMQKGVISCIEYKAMVNAHDGIADFEVNVDTKNNSQPHLTWSIDYDKTSSDVILTDFSDNSISVQLPPDVVTEVWFKSCFIPTFTGDTSVKVGLKDGIKNDTKYTVLPAPLFKVTNNSKTTDDDRSTSEITLEPIQLRFHTHRIPTQTELGAYIIECGVAPFDSEMIIEDCTLRATVWEKKNYIGMVELHRPHYDPESNYENKEIWNSSKNKTYAGKEGEIDEDISLKFKVPPKDTITLQGLVELDKPTPINANHRCFEGDPLNHRGWAVFSKLRVTKTNPLWYDCEGTVRYITHDINTKFQILKENVVNTEKMPDLLVDTFSLGQNLATGLDIFNVNTDGGFVYDEDSDDGARNLFSLDDGQHLNIKTINPVSDVSNIRFDWYSNRISEFRENNISRIFRLYDKDGNVVFEYEYTNFQFDGDYVTCTVIIRVKNETGGWEQPAVLEGIDLKTDLEFDPVEIIEEEVDDYEIIDDDEEEIDSETDDDEDEDIEDDDSYYEDYIAPAFDSSDYVTTFIYGSSLHLELNKNNLTLTDEGYNGREVSRTITLIGSGYYFETYWENNNVDGTTEDIISYIDISLSETVLNAQNSEYYGDLIVSPFPVPYKKVVFTRESEEGTIYYLKDDGQPFKFLLEPFYQYYCGTDLVTREGASIFNLNNSHTYFYIENGLVRLGFNKYSGSLYLAKWDIVSKTWITTHYFHMSNDIKFSLASYSDDKIVIEAGNKTYFTIWRGHPYIMIQNPNDPIYFDSKFNYVLSDKVDGTEYTYPTIFSFMNTDNLLPKCIGGLNIDYDCLTITDDEIINGTDHDLQVDLPSPIIAGKETTVHVTLNPSTEDGEVHFLVDGEDIATVTTPFTWTTIFSEPGEHTIQAVYTGDEDDNISVSTILPLIVDAPTPAPNTHASNGTPQASTVKGAYKLTIIKAPSKMNYRDNSEIRLLLTRGDTPMPYMIVEIPLPTGKVVTRHTGNDGTISYYNNSTEYVPGSYQWGGRFYDNIDADHNGKVLCKTLKEITIYKATPKFTTNLDSSKKLKKGKYLHITLNGVAGGLKSKKITYTVDGGSKKSKTTNDKGKIYIPMNTTGKHKIKVSYAGSTRYDKKTSTINVQVVK